MRQQNLNREVEKMLLDVSKRLVESASQEMNEKPTEPKPERSLGSPRPDGK